jgi:hypothetical protein
VNQGNSHWGKMIGSQKPNRIMDIQKAACSEDFQDYLDQAAMGAQEGGQSLILRIQAKDVNP